MKGNSLRLVTHYFVFLAFFLTTAFAQAQNSPGKGLIEVLGTNTHMSSKAAEKLQNLTKHKAYKSIKPIKFQNVTEHQKEGLLTFTLPGNNQSLKARGLKIEVEDTDNYIWEGPLLEEEGGVSFHKKNGKAFGQIQKGNTTYEIYDLGNNEHVLIEYDNQFLDGKGCGLDDSFTAKNLEEEIYQEASSVTTTNSTSCERTIVRVLVLYTSKAEAVNPDINSAATMAIGKLNQGLANSGVSSSQLRYELAGVKAFNFTETPFEIDEDVIRLAGNWKAQFERDAFSADLVVLLTDGEYGGILGVAKDFGPKEADAYSIVEAYVASSTNVFAHEVGHLMGGRHHNDATGTIQHGYEFKTGTWPFRKRRQTIMYATWDSDHAIPNFSNPYVEYKDKATGTSSYNYNAKKLRETAATVAEFRSWNHTPPLSASISGPSGAYNTGTYTWCVTVNCGEAPYQYTWSYSYDGVTYYSGFGTGQCVSRGMPYNKHLYLKVVVQSANGQTATAYFSTLNNDIIKDPKDPVLEEPYLTEKALTDSTLPETEPIADNFVIYPNPARELTTVRVQVADLGKTEAELTVTDKNDKIYSKTTVLLNSSKTTDIEIPVHTLLPGLYIIRLKYADRELSKRLLIQ